MKLKQLVDRMMVYLQRRGGRVAEGAPLLREYGGNLIEGSNPSLSAKIKISRELSWHSWAARL